MNDPSRFARTTDPATSHAAMTVAAAATLSATVLNTLRKHGPCTTHELAALTGLAVVTVSPRIAPLRRRNLVVDTGDRRDKRAVWALAESCH